MTYQSQILPCDTAPVARRFDGSRIPCIWPSPGIEPSCGAMLYEGHEEDGEGFTTTGYIARLPDRDVWLNVSRFDFNPTQARFDWLARNGFPNRGFAPWNDAAIDEAIAREAAHV